VCTHRAQLLHGRQTACSPVSSTGAWEAGSVWVKLPREPEQLTGKRPSAGDNNRARHSRALWLLVRARLRSPVASTTATFSTAGSRNAAPPRPRTRQPHAPSVTAATAQCPASSSSAAAALPTPGPPVSWTASSCARTGSAQRVLELLCCWRKCCFLHSAKPVHIAVPVHVIGTSTRAHQCVRGRLKPACSALVAASHDSAEHGAGRTRSQAAARLVTKAGLDAAGAQQCQHVGQVRADDLE